MTERELPRLTRQSINSTLRSEGIFMQENGEAHVSQDAPQPQLQTSGTTAEESEASKRALAEYLGWKRRREKGEARVLDKLNIDLPILSEPPENDDPAGQAEWIKQKRFRDLTVQFVRDIADREERGHLPTREYLENSIVTLQIAIDNGEISSKQADALLREMNGMLKEAQEREVNELAVQLAKQAGEEKEFKDIQTDIQGIYKDIAKMQIYVQVNNPQNLPNLPPGWTWGVVNGINQPIPPGGGGGQGVPPAPPGQGGAGGQGPHGRRGITANLSEADKRALAEHARREALRYRLRKALGLDRRTANAPLQQARRNELLTQNPDLQRMAVVNGNNVDIFNDLRDFIGKLDINEISDFHMLTMDIANLRTSGANPQVSEESRRLLFEMMYEKLIGSPDQGAEDMHYKIGSFYIMDLLDKMDGMARNKFDREFFRHLSELQHVRQTMHELNIALKFGEQYKEFIIKELSAVGIDFVFNDVSGISQIFGQIERVGGNMASRGRKEWLSDADWRQIYKEVDQIYDLNNPDREVLQEYVIDAHGNPVLDAQGNPLVRNLTVWERDRALRLARILHAGLQRRGMYSFLGDLPPMVAGSARIASTQDVFIGRILMAKKQAAQFFPGSEEDSAGQGAQYFLERIADIEIEEGIKDNDPDKHTLYLRLFGFDPRTIVYDDCRSFDMMSHSWRGPKEFYDRILITDPQGNQTSLMAYLMEQARGLDPKSANPLLGAGSLGSAEKRDLSIRARDIVLGQRLYLSTFPRFGDFDNKLKSEIWKKISLLTPSSIATLLPDSINPQNQAVWEGMRSKLFAAEGRRVKRDSSRYFQHQTMADMQAERDAFQHIAGHDVILQNGQTQHNNGVAEAANWGQQQWTDILHYMGLDDLNQSLNTQEKEVLQGIIQTGIRRSYDLARAKMPFTFLVVDAPKVSFKPTDRKNGGVNDADFIRLLASDQQTLQEGYNEGFNSLVENPTEHVVEKVKKLIDSFARVHGRDASIKANKSVIIAWHQMAAMDWKAKWVPGVRAYQRLMEEATSVMEKYWQAARISMNEVQIKDSLYMIAQAVGMSNKELKKIREETGSGPSWIIVFWLRMVMAMLPPAAGEEFVKMVMPKFK